jgi:hypothetical protein
MARIGIRDGQLPSRLGHFRDAPYENDEFMAQLDELLAYGLDKPQLLRVMSKSLFNRPLERSLRDSLKWWREKLGKKAFVTFLSDSVASGLASSSAAAFNALIYAWYEKLGKKFTTFMCDGVASGLASPNAAAFNALLLGWYARLGEKFTTFMCDGVASGLASPNASAFDAKLHDLCGVVGADFVTLMSSGVACRILDASFFAGLVTCYERHSALEERAMLLKFVALGVAAIDRLGEAEFWRRVDELCTTFPRPTQKAALARLRDHGD